MEAVQLRKQARKPAFEEVWARIEEVRKDPACMKALRKWIKFHTS